MTAKPHSLRCRIRRVRRSLRHRHDSLSPNTRRRILFGMFIILMLLYGWILFRGIPAIEISPVEFPDFKFE